MGCIKINGRNPPLTRIINPQLQSPFTKWSMPLGEIEPQVFCTICGKVFENEDVFHIHFGKKHTNVANRHNFF